jgi:hypothetical protein
MNYIITEHFYGHIVLDSRMRIDGNRWIGEGRAWHYDGQGRLIKDTGWEPTGCVLICPEPEPRRWWEFWN